ncbi:MAG: response regulator [Candidatus Eisenbacteria bacterium]
MQLDQGRNGPKKRILVVDDEIYIVHILEFSLTMEGYEVVTASCGEDALRKAKERRPHLIVLDVMMPGMDGLEVARRLRADGETAEVPILMLSAKGRPIDREAGIENGADDYILKPFSPRRLLDRIRNLFERDESVGSMDEASNF